MGWEMSGETFVETCYTNRQAQASTSTICRKSTHPICSIPNCPTCFCACPLCPLLALRIRSSSTHRYSCASQISSKSHESVQDLVQEEDDSGQQCRVQSDQEYEQIHTLQYIVPNILDGVVYVEQSHGAWMCAQVRGLGGLGESNEI